MNISIIKNTKNDIGTKNTSLVCLDCPGFVSFHNSFLFFFTPSHTIIDFFSIFAHGLTIQVKNNLINNLKHNHEVKWISVLLKLRYGQQEILHKECCLRLEPRTWWTRNILSLLLSFINVRCQSCDIINSLLKLEF